MLASVSFHHDFVEVVEPVAERLLQYQNSLLETNDARRIVWRLLLC
jgi:hypothetical protein